MNDHRRTIAINMFRMRTGIPSSRFATFSSQIDQPLCLAHTDVVKRFEAYRIPAEHAIAMGADIIEVMEVSDWEEWVQVRDHDPSIRPVMTGFDELVDPSSVRSALVVPILKGQ
jgi:hypothetical protein